MKVSLKWLQTYFEEALPDVEVVAEALTMQALEVDEVTGESLDVKVLPDRASYALSHRGIARELSAVLGLAMKHDPLLEPLPPHAPTQELRIEIEESEKCHRYLGAVVRGVVVGPSPLWLQEALESVGQRSINNVVDATNYVMLNIGQPLHAFDAVKLTRVDGALAISVCGALEGEHITTLSGDDIVLPEGTLLIRDRNADAAIGIAGIKGGKLAEVDAATTDLVVEAATFDASSVRRAAQGLKLFTDASLRFQNRLSSELAAYGMRDVLALITEVAGGEVVGVVDQYPAPEQARLPVAFSLADVERVLGVRFSASDVEEALKRLSLPYVTLSDGVFQITPPFERNDIGIPEDLVEEVGRTIGYDRVPALLLAPLTEVIDNAHGRGLERVKDFLVARGYTEVATRSFNESGEVMLRNPLDMTKPALRASLAPLLQEALQKGVVVAPRALGPAKELLLFEVGTVFTKEGERLSLSIAYAPLEGKRNQTRLNDEAAALLEAFPEALANQVVEGDVCSFELRLEALSVLGEGYEPQPRLSETFTPFSVYPFALRDIAVWTPSGTERKVVESVIKEQGGEHLVRVDCFDQFEKEGRISYAFRLVFESPSRTLSEEDLVPVMEGMTNALNAQTGFEVR